MKIPIVNEQDEIIGYKDRKDRNADDIIRVSRLWVKDEHGNVLFAQRATGKERGPGLWGPAVDGTVEEGETYESNILKEAKEEIGLVDIEIKPWKKVRLRNFWYFFVAFVPNTYPFVKQDNEVEALRWLSKEQFMEAYEKNPDSFVRDMKELALEFFNYENQN